MSDLGSQLRQAFDGIPSVPLEQASRTATQRRRRRKQQGVATAAIVVVAAVTISLVLVGSSTHTTVTVATPGDTRAGGHGSGTTAPSRPAGDCGLTKSFNNGYLQFRYPGCWTAVSYTEVSSFSSSIVYLSDQTTHPPCHAIANGTSCGWPVDKLAAGHVLVQWSTNGFPGWTLSKAPGSSTTVGGRQAREDVSKPGQCSFIGADETISAAVTRPAAADNWYGMTACLRNPGDTQAMTEVQQMLSTVTFTGP